MELCMPYHGGWDCLPLSETQTSELVCDLFWAMGGVRKLEADFPKAFAHIQLLSSSSIIALRAWPASLQG